MEVGPEDILVADDGAGSELVARHKGVILKVSLDTRRAQRFPILCSRNTVIPEGARVLILRAGGIGDHIMSGPAIEAFRKKRLNQDGQALWLSVQADMFPLFESHPDIDRLLPLPATLDQVLEADYVLDLSSMIQAEDFTLMHPIDVYMAAFGVAGDAREQSIKPFLRWCRPQPSQACTHLLEGIRKDNPGKKLVTLHWQASVQLRTFPPERFARLTWINRDCVFLVAHHCSQSENTQRMIQEYGLNAINLSAYMTELDNFLYIIKASDFVISADTCAYHAAAGFRVPSLSLFGSLSSHLRTSYYPDNIALDAHYVGKSCRSPCGRHKGKCPEAHLLGTPYSPCLLSYAEDRINAAFEQLKARML